jgi:DNA (cytosine-5)-methyltransferase 1
VTFGSLFAGIGGLDLGLERAGLECRWQVEIDPFARRVLAKHWPDVRRHDDVRTFPPGPLEQWYVDLICGGFPCQDVSQAGKQVGINGKRSGLWKEYVRIIRELRPRYVLVENVPGLLVRGMDRVLGDLAEIGFNAEWSVFSACSLGAPHTRERLFILAYSCRERFSGSSVQSFPSSSEEGDWCYYQEGMRRQSGCTSQQASRYNQWEIEPRICRVADGVPDRVDRLRSLGNAIVPQIAEWIGRRILAMTA